MVQLLRFKKATGTGDVWINPDQVIYVEVGDLKENKGKVTIVHVTGKDGKLFIKEHPDEINKILRSLKKDIKLDITASGL